MMEFKSDYDILMEELKNEGRIKELPPEQVVRWIKEINEEVSADDADLKRKSIESAKELANIVLNA